MQSRGFWEIAVFANTISFILLGSGWVGGGRKFVMDKEGCTIHFLWFKRRYKWEELQTRRYAVYRTKIFSQNPPRFVQSGAEFSVKKIKKFRHTDATTYAKRHPFTFFYVSFPDKETEPQNVTYLVDETEFRELMQEWGVEMEEYKVGTFFKWSTEQIDYRKYK